MGKAKIISGGTDGLYTIEIDAGAQQQASRVEAINQELTALAERIAQAETDYLATSTAETHAAAILNVAVENYVAAVAENPETASTADVDRLTGDYYTAARFAGEARTRLQGLLLQQRQLESDKATLANAPASETRQAWCADLTEDAAGDVATIEVPGEPGTVLVAPGGRAPSAGDGALLARELMTPEQAFFNAAILPGWQKWMPTFRTGTITAINSDNDTADVSLDAATSSAQGLGVNQSSSLSGVPVEYMECNAAAFEVGDPCVVRFDGQSWDSPRVVGFAREPKGCDWPCINARNRYWYTYEIPKKLFNLLTSDAGDNAIVSFSANGGNWLRMGLEYRQSNVVQWRNTRSAPTLQAQIDDDAKTGSTITVFANQLKEPYYGIFEFRITLNGKQIFYAKCLGFSPYETPDAYRSSPPISPSATTAYPAIPLLPF